MCRGLTGWEGALWHSWVTVSGAELLSSRHCPCQGHGPHSPCLRPHALSPELARISEIWDWGPAGAQVVSGVRSTVVVFGECVVAAQRRT